MLRPLLLRYCYAIVTLNVADLVDDSDLTIGYRSSLTEIVQIIGLFDQENTLPGWKASSTACSARRNSI